jgi:hypothetical protein
MKIFLKKKEEEERNHLFKCHAIKADAAIGKFDRQICF